MVLKVVWIFCLVDINWTGEMLTKMRPICGGTEILGVEPHSQLQVMVLLSSVARSSCLDISKKCPSWDMGLHTQLRGVKIVSIMRVYIMKLDRYFNGETLSSGPRLLFCLQNERWNTLIWYTSLSFNYKLNGETLWSGTRLLVLITNWMVKHFDLGHASYFNYKLNGETLWFRTRLLF